MMSFEKRSLVGRTDLLLLFCRALARSLGLSLVADFEDIIGRALLAAGELHRLQVDLTQAKRILVHIEDKEFYSHKGVSVKGLARLLLSAIKWHRRSGGSTITQQLARTLFINDYDKLYRRKVVEILLALWLNNKLAKEQQLEMYLASVRYESRVYGLSDAVRHFFGNTECRILAPEAFFLVERVSNTRSRLLVEKIDQTLRSLVSAGVLPREDVHNVLELYKEALMNGLVQDPTGVALKRLEQAWDVGPSRCRATRFTPQHSTLLPSVSSF